MAQINKKYSEDFDKFCRDWARFSTKPNRLDLDKVFEDISELHYDLKHMEK